MRSALCEDDRKKAIRKAWLPRQELAKDVANADADSNAIQFQIKVFRGLHTRKAKLDQVAGVFVRGTGEDILFASPSGFPITLTGKESLDKYLKAEFQLGVHRRRRTISPDAFERFQAWKSGSAR